MELALAAIGVYFIGDTMNRIFDIKDRETPINNPPDPGYIQTYVMSEETPFRPLNRINPDPWDTYTERKVKSAPIGAQSQPMTRKLNHSLDAIFAKSMANNVQIRGSIKGQNSNVRSAHAFAFRSGNDIKFKKNGVRGTIIGNPGLEKPEPSWYDKNLFYDRHRYIEDSLAWQNAQYHVLNRSGWEPPKQKDVPPIGIGIAGGPKVLDTHGLPMRDYGKTIDDLRYGEPKPQVRGQGATVDAPDLYKPIDAIDVRALRRGDRVNTYTMSAVPVSGNTASSIGNNTSIVLNAKRNLNVGLTEPVPITSSMQIGPVTAPLNPEISLSTRRNAKNIAERPHINRGDVSAFNMIDTKNVSKRVQKDQRRPVNIEQLNRMGIPELGYTYDPGRIDGGKVISKDQKRVQFQKSYPFEIHYIPGVDRGTINDTYYNPTATERRLRRNAKNLTADPAQPVVYDMANWGLASKIKQRVRQLVSEGKIAPVYELTWDIPQLRARTKADTGVVDGNRRITRTAVNAGNTFDTYQSGGGEHIAQSTRVPKRITTDQTRRRVLTKSAPLWTDLQFPT